MIENILERLREKSNEWFERWAESGSEDEYADGRSDSFDEAIQIVQEVAKEYGKDTNVRSNDFISRSVLLDKLQKWKFANEERGYDTASDLVQEMIDLVKEQPSAPYQKGE